MASRFYAQYYSFKKFISVTLKWRIGYATRIHIWTECEIFTKTYIFEVLTAVVMKGPTFWDIMPCTPLKVNRSFGVTFRIHCQGRRRNQLRNRHGAGHELGSFFDPENPTFLHIYFRLKCNWLSSYPSFSLHVSAAYCHHQVVSILIKLLHFTYRAWKRYLLIKIN
jgi:hypothetical protein